MIGVAAVAGSACIIGQIIVIIVAIVVAYFTAGAALSVMGPLLSAAFGAAVGSIASQLVGIALGVQEKFSWKAVAVAAVTAGLTKGIGIDKLSVVGSNSGSVVNQVINGAISNAVDQGVNIAVGLQDKFSWRDLAVSAVSAPIAARVGDAVGKKIDSNFGAKGHTNTFASSFVSGLASGASTVVVKVALGGKVDSMATIADVFGNALGNSLVEKIDSWRTARHVDKVRNEVVGLHPELAGTYDTFVKNGGNPDTFVQMMRNQRVQQQLSNLALLKSKGAQIESETSAADVWQTKLESSGDVNSVYVDGYNNKLHEGKTFGMATLQSIAELQAGLGEMSKSIPFEEAMMALQVASMGPGAYVLDWAKGKLADSIFGPYLEAGVKKIGAAFTAGAHGTDIGTIESLLDVKAIDAEYAAIEDRFDANPTDENRVALDQAREQRGTVLRIQGEVMQSNMGAQTLGVLLIMGVGALKKMGQYRGGRHGDTKGPVGDGKESNHMPADSTSPIPRDDGPAIQMDPSDHRATSSWGGSTEAIEYRKELKDMIDNGQMRDAMAREIRDVRRVATEVAGQPRKYNEAMREMLEYAKDAGYLDKPPK